MRSIRISPLAVFLVLLLLPAWLQAADFIASSSFSGKNGIAVTFTAPVDKAVADEMKKMIDANVTKGDRNLISGDSPVKQVMFRLIARQ